MKDETIIAPFSVVHVDAHTDPGLRLNRRAAFIETELLPVEQRRPEFSKRAARSKAGTLLAVVRSWHDGLLHRRERNR